MEWEGKDVWRDEWTVRGRRKQKQGKQIMVYGHCYNSYGTCREMSHTYTVHHCMSIINSLVCFYFCCCLAKNRFLSYLNVCMMLSPVTFLIASVQYM